MAFHYGAAADYYTVTSYSFSYRTGDSLAIGKLWTEASSGPSELDTGDIYTS